MYSEVCQKNQKFIQVLLKSPVLAKKAKVLKCLKISTYTWKSKIIVQNIADETTVPTFTNFEAFVQEERSTSKALVFASLKSFGN